MNARIFTVLCFMCCCGVFLISCKSPAVNIRGKGAESADVVYTTKAVVRLKSKTNGTSAYIHMLASQFCNKVLRQPALLVEGSLLFFNTKNKWPQCFDDLLTMTKHPAFLARIKKADFEKTSFTTMEGGSLKITYAINTENSESEGSVVIARPGDAASSQRMRTSVAEEDIGRD